MPLPTGTVTFLFTDIEGSTKLWERFPDTMQSSLARHDALMREAIAEAGGTVFKTVGDAFCAAFATAPAALQAVLAAQLALHREEWPNETPIRVRMALHTGVAQERDGDYFGPVLNRVARLIATGHGGQTLLSAPTWGLLRDMLPSGTTLRDLGSHRLKDLERPEQIYQVNHPQLPDTFAPLKSLENTPNNLPQQLTSFIGREKEMAEIDNHLTTTRLLTLVGTGGTGKTRLALQSASALLDTFDHGIWLVELAPLSDASLIAQTVASALGVREQAGVALERTLIEFLSSRKLLLILDNCEHLLADCARLVASILRSCAEVRIIATSRESLSIAGEQIYRVPSLSLPDPKAPLSQTIEGLSQYESVRLFIERALVVKPDFTITNLSAPALAAICHRLDGIPLAIELAAARVRSLSVEDIHNRLDSRFRLLSGGDRAALPRQQTLRALVDWSYDLLSDNEKILLTRLSVFAGSWSLDAVESVCTFEPLEDWEAMDLLTSLVDKSLAFAETVVEDGSSRYRMLETLRQYSAEKLEGAGESSTVRERHLAWYLALAEEAEPQLHGANQVRCLNRLESEHDNLRAALEWSAANKALAESGVRLASALFRFWYIRGYLTEGREHLTRALESDGEGTIPRAKAILARGTLAQYQGDYAVARALIEEGLALSQELGDTQTIAMALNGLGTINLNQGDYASAQTFYEESLALSRELGNKLQIAHNLNNLGLVAHYQGLCSTARPLFEESLALRRELGDTFGIATALASLGLVVLQEDDYTTAESLFEESLDLSRELGDREGVALTLLHQGNVSLNKSDFAAARTFYEESLALSRELGSKQFVAHTLNNLGLVALSETDYETARPLFEESLALQREMGEKRGIAYGLNSLGSVYMEQDDYDTAVPLLEEGLTLFRTLGEKHGTAIVLTNLGTIRYLQGSYSAARPVLEECLTLYLETGHRSSLADALEPLAGIALQESRMRSAAIQFSISRTLRENIGVPLPPHRQAALEEQITAVRTALGEDAFTIAWTEGQQMTVEEAVAFTLNQ